MDKVKGDMKQKTSRREFLETACCGLAVGAFAGGGCSPATACAGTDVQEASADFHFTEPFDGGIVHEQSGFPVLGTEPSNPKGGHMLKVEVSGIAPDSAKLELFTADGRKIQARQGNGTFQGVALLRDRVTEIRCRATIDGVRREIRTRPVWAKNSFPRFRCFIDDHSAFFRDVARNKYKSLFDCFYLARLRELHRNFGVKINLNCFNTTPERDFSLSMFPDTYKSEFEDNADWLRLAFHSENLSPKIPYRNATPEQLAADFDLVAGELKRIAGRAYTAGLQIHWADVPPDCYKVLADRGVKMLQTRGRKPDAKSKKICDYHLPDEVLAYLHDYQGWMHFESGLIFYSSSGCGCDWTPVDKIVPKILKHIENPAKNHLASVTGHEFYWWPFYKHFVPDIYDRFATAFRVLLDHGYKPIWIEDGFFGGLPA
jgi:hypothetical protein